MPNIKGAGKRMRQSEKARVRNIAAKTRIKHVRRKMLSAAPGAGEADATFREYCSVLDKAVKKGMLKKNTAVRRKSRAAARLKSTAPVPSAPAAEAPAEG